VQGISSAWAVHRTKLHVRCHLIGKFGAVGALILALVLFRPLSFAQPTPPSSISGRFFSVRIVPNVNALTIPAIFNTPEDRLIVQGASVLALIARAYEVPMFTVQGGPQWIQQNYLYDIEAVPPPAFIPSNGAQMMQALLADRFQLQLHTEIREIETWVLELSEGALLASPAEAGQANRIRLFRPRDGVRQASISGNASMAELGRTLENYFAMPVIDATGIDGLYNISLSGFESDDPASFAAVLQEQLGISMTLRLMPAELLVISRIEHPRLDNDRD